jgi:hypothetical protein
MAPRIHWLLRYILVPTLLALYGAAYAASQATAVHDPRPVAKAVAKLEMIYGWPITYEDPPYAHPSDLVDVTASVRHDTQDNKTFIPRGGRLAFTYDLSSTNIPSMADVPAALTAIKRVLHSYANSRGAEMFTVMQADTIFHVVPTQFTNASGQLEKITPLLDMTISVPPKQRTGADLVDEICRTLSAATSQTVIVGTISTKTLGQHTTTVTASSAPARSVLDRLLQELDVPLSWRLLYDPSLRWYVLNVHPVTPANK